MIYVLKQEGKLKGSDAGHVTVIGFDDKEQAERFCETNTDLESKYWTYYQIIDLSERVELFYNH